MGRPRKRLHGPPLNLEKKTIKSIIGASSVTLALILSLSLFSSTGALLSIKDFFFSIFGIGIVFVPLALIALGLFLFSIRLRFLKNNLILGFIGAILSLLGLTASLSDTQAGAIGKSLYASIKAFLTAPGAIFLLIFTFVVSVIIATNTSVEDVVSALASLGRKISGLFKGLKRKKLSIAAGPRIARPSPNQNPEMVTASELIPFEKGGLPQKVVANDPYEGKIWQYPPLSLLSDIKGQTANRGNVKQNAHTIEKTLESFGISAKVIEVNPGPTVTQYALEIPMGTKLSKILSLQNNLALNLATKTGDVRIEAPIPGKSLVGIEIPNISPETVSLKNVLQNENLRQTKSKIVVGLGEDVSGNIVTADIAKMPHVLVAGTTGSGKSVLLNAMICTLLFRASPQEVKLILADPKRVELTEYNDIPHLLTPVITDADKILSSLKWAQTEMEKRYRMFHEAKVKNIVGYNEDAGFQRLPYIIIVIDELQNLMEFAPVEVEDAICRLAAMARATGIHLVLATQRPSVDVITGLIKANIPCRIAFNVSSGIDSRVILDTPGAEKLLGKGDMLYVPPDASKPQRIQGVYVSDHEIQNLIKFLKGSGFTPEYTEEVLTMPTTKLTGTAGMSGEKDDFFDEAVRTVCQYDRASASLLQRRLRIGYARAARLIDELEAAGIIGQGEGSKPRDVLQKNAEEFLQNQNEPAPESA